MNTVKTLRYIFLILLLAIAGLLVYFLTRKEEPREYATDPARINAIREMVNLCTLDFYEEIPFKDSINGKWIVATEKIRGSVKFNLEDLKIKEHGDTTIVFLPKEKVEILESSDPGAYRVIDCWDSRRPVFGRVLTAREENILKERFRKRTLGKIYAKGYVKRARRNAVETLTPLFSNLRGPAASQGPVIVIDSLSGATP